MEGNATEKLDAHKSAEYPLNSSLNISSESSNKSNLRLAAQNLGFVDAPVPPEIRIIPPRTSAQILRINRSIPTKSDYLCTVVRETIIGEDDNGYDFKAKVFKSSGFDRVAHLVLESHVYGARDMKLFSRTSEFPAFDLGQASRESLRTIDFLLENSSILLHELVLSKIKGLQELNDKYGRHFHIFPTDTITLYGNKQNGAYGFLQNTGIYLDITAVHFNYFTKASNAMNSPMPDEQQSYVVATILQCVDKGSRRIWPDGLIGRKLFARIPASVELTPSYARASMTDRVTKLMRASGPSILAVIEETLAPEALRVYENYFNKHEFDIPRLDENFETE